MDVMDHVRAIKNLSNSATNNRDKDVKDVHFSATHHCRSMSQRSE
jgi:hypothetical protein